MRIENQTSKAKSLNYFFFQDSFNGIDLFHFTAPRTKKQFNLNCQQVYVSIAIYSVLVQEQITPKYFKEVSQ